MAVAYMHVIRRCQCRTHGGAGAATPVLAPARTGRTVTKRATGGEGVQPARSPPAPHGTHSSPPCRREPQSCGSSTALAPRSCVGLYRQLGGLLLGGAVVVEEVTLGATLQLRARGAGSTRVSGPRVGAGRELSGPSSWHTSTRAGHQRHLSGTSSAHTGTRAEGGRGAQRAHELSGPFWREGASSTPSTGTA